MRSVVGVFGRCPHENTEFEFFLNEIFNRCHLATRGIPLVASYMYRMRADDSYKVPSPQVQLKMVEEALRAAHTGALHTLQWRGWVREFPDLALFGQWQLDLSLPLQGRLVLRVDSL